MYPGLIVLLKLDGEVDCLHPILGIRRELLNGK